MRVLRTAELVETGSSCYKGSHVNVKMPNGQLVTIPDHGELKVGLLQAALKKAGLSVSEFRELLGR